jgi:hypothetical protein
MRMCRTGIRSNIPFNVDFSQYSETTSSEHSGNLLTRSKPFKAIVKRAFQVCDNDQTGEVGKLELYAGLLWVHLNLAKYAGPAACYVRSADRLLKRNAGVVDIYGINISSTLVSASIISHYLFLFLVSLMYNVSIVFFNIISPPLVRFAISSLRQPIVTNPGALIKQNLSKSWA